MPESHASVWFKAQVHSLILYCVLLASSSRNPFIGFVFGLSQWHHERDPVAADVVDSSTMKDGKYPQTLLKV